MPFLPHRLPPPPPHPPREKTLKGALTAFYYLGWVKNDGADQTVLGYAGCSVFLLVAYGINKFCHDAAHILVQPSRANFLAQ